MECLFKIQIDVPVMLLFADGIATNTKTAWNKQGSDNYELTAASGKPYSEPAT